MSGWKEAKCLRNVFFLLLHVCMYLPLLILCGECKKKMRNATAYLENREGGQGRRKVVIGESFRRDFFPCKHMEGPF